MVSGRFGSMEGWVGVLMGLVCGFWLYSTGGFGLNYNFDCFRMGVGGFRFVWEDWLVLVVNGQFQAAYLLSLRWGWVGLVCNYQT